MASTARIDELKKKFDENPRRYFAPLANEFRKAGDIEQAILICEEFLPQQPGHMSGHIVYGQALFEAGRLPESRAVFETALGLDPENLIALRHLGDIARGQGDFTSARTWYLRVLDADPRNEEIQGVIASLDAEAGPGIPASAFAAEAERLADEGDIPTQIIEAVKTPEAPQWLSDMPTTEIPRVVPPPLPPPAPISTEASNELLDGFSLEGLESHTDTSSAESASTSTQAEGLEPTEFTPPEEAIAESDDLDDSLESGVPSFSAPTQRIESLAGLEGSGASASDVDDLGAGSFPPLDLDDGLTLPPQGDPVVASAPVEERTEAASSATDFDADLLDVDTEEMIPVELPPAVIAAEAELTEPEETPVAKERIPEQPFVTETMAELYLAQGLRVQALSVYEQLAAASPGDARLRERVRALQSAHEFDSDGPNVRDFFARLASRRPGMRSLAAEPPSSQDFASEEPAPSELVTETRASGEFAVEQQTELGEAKHETAETVMIHELEVERATDVLGAPDFGASTASGASSVAPAIERAAAMRNTPPGSIDALFGNRPSTRSEDSAASALAQAFGGAEPEPPAITGRPARAASEELSLDSVFRDGPTKPTRSSQSFSFDQFFSEGAATAAGERASATPRASQEIIKPGEPAERSADDIEQFNSWLQGLKQR